MRVGLWHPSGAQSATLSYSSAINESGVKLFYIFYLKGDLVVTYQMSIVGYLKCGVKYSIISAHQCDLVTLIEYSFEI